MPRVMSRARLVRLAGKVPQVLALYVLVLSTLAFGVVWSLRSDDLRDLGSFIASGRAAAQGENPYGVYPLTFVVSVPELGMRVHSPNLNPPISVLIFEPLAELDPVTVARTWYALSLFLYIVALVLLVRANPAHSRWLRIVWAMGLAGLWHTLEARQIYMPLLLLCVVAWLLLRQRRYGLAGILLGVLVALKPNFAVWPGLLLLAGYWRVAIPALAAAAAISVLPALVYGPRIYFDWLAASRAFTGMLLPNASLASIATRLGVPWLGTLSAVALLLALAMWAWKRRPEVAAVSGLALVGALLASPLTWTGYTLFLLPALFERSWSWPEKVAAAMLAFPTFLVLHWFGLSWWHSLLLGPTYGWALLLILGAWGARALRGTAITTMAEGTPASVRPAHDTQHA